MPEHATAALCAALLISAAGAPALAQPSPAPAPLPAGACELKDGTVLVTQGAEQKPLPLPARAEAILRVGDELWVALGEEGVQVYRLSGSAPPALLRRVASPGGRAVGLHAAGGEIWMELQSTSAVPVGRGRAQAEAPAPVAGPPPGPAAPAIEARPAQRRIKILKVTSGSVELDAGQDAGVKVGDRFAVFRIVSLASADGGDFVGRELAAVVEVTAVKAESALAQLARGSRVRESEEVEPAGAQQSPSLAFPPRLDGLLELSATLRPLVKVGAPLGIGALAELTGTWIGRSYFAGVRVQPLGLGWTKDGNVVSISATAEGGYDTRAFAVGLGVGVSTINGNLDYMLGASSGVDTTGQPAYTQETKTAFTLTQLVRLGARDGLHLFVSNVLLYHRDSSQREGFIYGGTSGRLVIPLAQRTDLFAEGGGGRMGYGFGGVGVSSWIVGSGDAGSLGISVSAGGAGVWGSREVTQTYGNNPPYTTQERVDITGPMASVGVVYRLRE